MCWAMYSLNVIARDKKNQMFLCMPCLGTGTRSDLVFVVLKKDILYVVARCLQTMAKFIKIHGSVSASCKDKIKALLDLENISIARMIRPPDLVISAYRCSSIQF